MGRKRAIKRPNCLKCKHYHVTYDPQKPRGCSLFGLKSAQFPSWLVKKESGQDCTAYDEKDHVKEQEKKKGVDLTRDDLW